jgi:Tfp pilus assembly protein PilF
MQNPSIEIDAKIQELIPYVQKVMDIRDTALEETLFELIHALGENHPHEAKVFAIYGDMYQATDQNEQARRSYEKTLALDDSVFPVWDQLIAIQAKQKDWDSLIKTTEAAMDVFPNQGILFYYNGIGYCKKTDFLEAESSLGQALLMSGRDPGLKYNVLVQLGEVYYELSKYSKSNETFEKAIDINGNAFSALNNYAYFLALRKENLSQANALIEKALKTRPDDYRGYHTQGLIFLKQGDSKRAMEAMEIALTKQGSQIDPALFEHLGDANILIKESDKAVEFWQKALELGGDEDRLTKKLNDNKVN